MKPSRSSLQALVRIKDGLFSSTTSARVKAGADYIFPQAIPSLDVAEQKTPQGAANWALTGPQKTNLLKIISGQFIPAPPLARTYPYFARRNLNYYEHIQFLNFSESSGLDKVHLSARYESFSYKGELDMSDDVNSVKNYITGANNYNNNHAVDARGSAAAYVGELLDFFDLAHLQDKWINSLSNGQLRRARIAKSLINKPKLLIIDDPFLGLDPQATVKVSNSLARVAAQFDISVVLGLRVQDAIPEWVSHVGYVDADGLQFADSKAEVEEALQRYRGGGGRRDLDGAAAPGAPGAARATTLRSSPITNDELRATIASPSPPHIEFNNASVVYKSVPVLQDFNWVVPRGSKWRILGNNGTGKTTILSLITADHPQSWRKVLSIDGKLRKTGSGSSFFEVNNRIGISSPELHALVPPSKTMNQIIMTGLSRDVGNSNFMFVAKDDKLTPHARALLARFQDRLDQHGETSFHELSLTDQKLALFLRATVKKPEILILDEAFSCMDDIDVMSRCHDLVAEWSDTTVLSIGHIDWELAASDYVLKLQGGGKPYFIEKYTAPR